MVLSANPLPSDGTVQSEHIVSVKWSRNEIPRREFAAVACPEEEGGFSIFAVNYPGVVSQGDTLEEALANIAEAFLGMLESRQKHGESLEVARVTDIPPGGIYRWITVDG